MEFINLLKESISIKLLIVVILMDTFFGILRGIKNKKINSCIGIDGMIRKTGMIIAELFLKLIDYIIDFNLISFLPYSIKEIIELNNIGIGDLFCILFICFEFISVLKNMSLCSLPIPKKLENILENILKEFTSELEGKDKN